MELVEILLGFQESLLDQVRSAAFSAKIRIELTLGKQVQVTPAGLKGLAQGFARTGTGGGQPLRSLLHPLSPKHQNNQDVSRPRTNSLSPCIRPVNNFMQSSNLRQFRLKTGLY
jgi:hypothetical protein